MLVLKIILGNHGIFGEGNQKQNAFQPKIKANDRADISFKLKCEELLKWCLMLEKVLNRHLFAIINKTLNIDMSAFHVSLFYSVEF